MYHLGILRMVRGSNEGSSDEWSDQRGFIMESLSALASAMRNQAHSQVPTPEPSHPATVSYEKFLKLDPPTFAGKPDPDAAENWILEIERVFQVLTVPEDKKTLYGTFRLLGAARHWWDTTRNILFPTDSFIPWEAFKKAFLENYFPPHARERKKVEFLELCQGSLSLVDYISRFQELERHCPNLFADDRERAGKFIRGLKEGLRPRVLNSMPSTLSAAVAAATLLTEDWERSKSTQSKKPPVAGNDQKRYPSGGQAKRPPSFINKEGGRKPYPPSKRQRPQGNPPAR
jgi:hypothetical protein